MISIDIILGVNFHVNEQAELYDNSKRREFNKENYSFVFKSPNFQVPHAKLRQCYEKCKVRKRSDAYVNNLIKEVGSFIQYTVYLYYR